MSSVSFCLLIPLFDLTIFACGITINIIKLLEEIMKFIKAPNMFLPRKDINMKKWSVIACDQFTSEPEYWEKVKKSVGKSPSTLNLIYPEVYLPEFSKEAIDNIHKNMEEYVNNGVLEAQGECLILVDRQLGDYNRLGLMIAVDLERYDYRKENTTSLIRPSEATVIERLPIRVEIKTGATLDLPHIILLMNDRKYNILNSLYSKKDEFEKVYDFDIRSGKDHITGYKITDKKLINTVINQLIDLNKETKFLVGDGNHSLASAKMCWENKKRDEKIGFFRARKDPARFALVELEDASDEKMVIEPIHRLLTHVNKKFVDGLKKLCPNGTRKQKLHFSDGSKDEVSLPENSVEAICMLQEYIDKYLKENEKVEIDYIHNTKNLLNLVKSNKKAVGIEFPQIDKNELFDYVGAFGPMPRKSFSIGKAEEKRFYLESKRI